MEFWSAGLGRRSSLQIACGSEETESKGRDLVLTGNVVAPVTWVYTITIEPRAWPDFFEVALCRPVATFLASHPRRWSLLAKFAVLGLLFFARYTFFLMLSPLP